MGRLKLGARPIPLLIILALVLFLFADNAFAAAFVPEQPTISAEKLRAGMEGYTLTVIKGTTPVKLPLEIVSVIPQKGPSAEHSIMIRMLPSAHNRAGGVAQGMSGSPVYVDGKLAGAISSGWGFSDHNIAMVTPIEDMQEIFSKADSQVSTMGRRPAFLNSLTVNGLSQRAVAELQSALGVQLESGPYGASGELPLDNIRFSPGDAATVFLAWGDVELAATGTVTATSKDGRFLAFGHPFMERGEVDFPIARATIHETVASQAFPFKVASPVSMAGTVTQDRPSGIGGVMGYFTPSIAASFVLKDMDDANNERIVKNFRVVPDVFLSGRLLSGIYSGLLDAQWGRKGEGTATVTMRVDGQGLLKGWTRSNIFFSDSDLSGFALVESAAIIDTIMLQPFEEVQPIGFRLDVSVTREPKVLYIEDVVVSSDAAPGDTLDVEVTLRPWRREPVKRRFELKIPQDATGSCELVTRGGGINSLSQLALDGGWKSIDGFERLLTEINATDANNELILELQYDKVDKTKPGDKKTAELIQEEKEFLSETKARRIKEGTLRIYRSEYYVDGLMKRVINLKEQENSDG